MKNRNDICFEPGSPEWVELNSIKNIPMEPGSPEYQKRQTFLENQLTYNSREWREWVRKANGEEDASISWNTIAGVSILAVGTLFLFFKSGENTVENDSMSPANVLNKYNEIEF